MSKKQSNKRIKQEKEEQKVINQQFSPNNGAIKREGNRARGKSFKKQRSSSDFNDNLGCKRFPKPF